MYLTNIVSFFHEIYFHLCSQVIILPNFQEEKTMRNEYKEEGKKKKMKRQNKKSGTKRQKTRSDERK
jgi:hypothetical protein